MKIVLCQDVSVCFQDQNLSYNRGSSLVSSWIFPIVVSLASQWIAGVKTIQKWRNFRPRLRKYLSTLEVENTKFLNTLETLLIDVLAAEDEVAKLTSNPNHLRWESSEFNQAFNQGSAGLISRSWIEWSNFWKFCRLFTTNSGRYVLTPEPLASELSNRDRAS